VRPAAIIFGLLLLLIILYWSFDYIRRRARRPPPWRRGRRAAPRQVQRFHGLPVQAGPGPASPRCRRAAGPI